MDLQTRKYSLIEYLIELNDESILSKIENAISSHTIKSSSPKTLSQKQLIERAKKSNDDYQNGRFKSQEQLENESLNW